MSSVAVLTTSRADYGHVRPPLQALHAHPGLDVTLIAIGAQLSPAYGCAVAEIRRDGIPVDYEIECLLSSDSDVGMAKTIQIAGLGLADVLGKLRPDVVLLVADRYEMLAPASVALALRIPIAHIEGGEISAGAIDDAVRNALTKMAHIHFTSTSNARRRVIAMGEEPWRVHHAGAPSLDNLASLPQRNRDRWFAQWPQFQTDQPVIVVSHHPVTLSSDPDQEVDVLFDALAQFKANWIWCFPNADAGSYTLMQRAKAFCDHKPNAELCVNLPHMQYLDVLQHADVLVGNSSSGIMEAASFGLPVVNIGTRQQGRERSVNVLDATARTDEIKSVLTQALQPAFRQRLEGMENLYGNGTAATTIADVLAHLPDRDRLLQKVAAPLHATAAAFHWDAS